MDKVPFLNGNSPGAYPTPAAFGGCFARRSNPQRDEDAALDVWLDLLTATVIKHTKHKRVVEITRRMTQGTLERAQDLLTHSQGGTVLNTAFIERLNATFRERLEALETGMYLIGCVYNFCMVVHDKLSSSKHFGTPTTPAMAAGLTARRWSLKEVLLFQVAPPA